MRMRRKKNLIPRLEKCAAVAQTEPQALRGRWLAEFPGHDELRAEIGKILGVDKQFRTILIGAGNLGRAIATHINFDTRGCELIGIFDSNEQLTGKTVGNLKIMNIKTLESFCCEKHPIVAVLCIPKAATQQIADTLVGMGLKAFWNFSHYDLSIGYDDIIVENVHLGDSLLTLTYGVNVLTSDDDDREQEAEE